MIGRPLIAALIPPKPIASPAHNDYRVDELILSCAGRRKVFFSLKRKRWECGGIFIFMKPPSLE